MFKSKVIFHTISNSGELLAVSLASPASHDALKGAVAMTCDSCRLAKLQAG